VGSPIPTNDAVFSVREILDAVGGTLLQGDSEFRAAGVSTDTRTLGAGAVFIALTGDRFDGHEFVATAVERGARVVVVSRSVDVPGRVAVIQVGDTVAALGALGRAHRRRWGLAAQPRGSRMVIAVGGSAGKTTTTRAIAAVLQVECGTAVHAPQGNLNNAIGVPMTLLGLKEHHRFAVVEIGTNRRGEVAQLAAIAEADWAVLTLIDLEHTEGIGTLADVADEEGDLVAALAPGAVAFGNADDPHVLAQLRRARSGEFVTVGLADDATVRIARRESVHLRSQRVVLATRGEPKRETITSLIGEPGARATALAWAVSERVLARRVTGAAVGTAMAIVAAHGDGRMVVRERDDGTVVIDDTYNANPASMRASIDTAREIARSRGARLVLVLGEMRELGALSPTEHEALGAYVAEVLPAFFVGVAGECARSVERARAGGVSSEFCVDSALAGARALDAVRAGDVVLVKGSRGVATERVVEALLGQPYERHSSPDLH